MINSLFGTVSGKMPGHLFLEYNGIEWDILVSDKALDIIAPVGNTAKISFKNNVLRSSRHGAVVNESD